MEKCSYLSPYVEMGLNAYLAQCANSHSSGSPFTDENSKTVESSAMNDGRSMLAMLLIVLCMVDGIETDMLM